MRKILTVFLLLQIFFVGVLNAQNIIRGTITNSATGEEAPAVSVIVKSTTEGTYSDDRGRFKIATQKKLPVTLIVSSIGYEPKEISVTGFSKSIDVKLDPVSELGQAIVVSASCTRQKKLSSPVTIEQISNKNVENSPQLNYMDMIQGLKGVDVTVSSIGFTSITTRGFNTSGNTNFTQIVDGMDNQAPGLNFPLGAAISLTQLDVDNIELLSGASSACRARYRYAGTVAECCR